jgi:hypothetical protein
MPILTRPEQYGDTELHQVKVRTAGKTDVLVVGAGPAGMGAAAGAAQAGADVLLVERYGFPGGNATAALVNPISSFYTHGTPAKTGIEPLLFPRDHGSGRPVVGGAFRDFMEILIEKGGCLRPSPETGFTTPFDPEIYKLAAMEMIDRKGIKVLLHAFATGILENRGVHQVFFATKSGTIAVDAAMVCDCTGDGDVAALAGASYEIGRYDEMTQPATLYFRIGNFSAEEFRSYVQAHPHDWNGVSGLRALMKTAAEKEGIEFSREDILFFGSPNEKEVFVNSTRIIGIYGTDVFDLTKAEWEGRRQMEAIFGFLKKYVPGFRNAYILQSGCQAGIRESRRIKGMYTLTEKDLLSARKFNDVIALCSYPIDVHNPAGKGTLLQNIPSGTAYHVPLRALIPEHLNRLLVAGRCISGTHIAHSSYRVMPASFATGHAAGVCAALASREGIAVDSVPAEKVQKELIRQGAILE